MQCYEYLVFKQEKRDKDGEVTDPAAIVVDRQTILAKSEDQARIIATKAIPDEHMAAVDRLVVVLRPF
jgi:hypothetical protein